MNPLHQLPGAVSQFGLPVFNGPSVPTMLKTNLAAAVDPTVTDDSAAGYVRGSKWINSTASRIFECVDPSVGAAVWVQLGASSGSGTSVKETVTAVNTFAVGDVIRKTGGGYALAQADSSGNAEVLGIIESASGSDFTVVYFGKVTNTAHGFTIGNVLFLSPSTPGAKTATEPTTPGQVSRQVAIVLDANTLLTLSMRSLIVGTTGNSFSSTVLSNVNQTLTRTSTINLKKYSGTLSGPVVINLSRTGAGTGDVFEVSLRPVATTGVNTLTFQENGAGSLMAFNDTVSLEGPIKFVFNGTSWEILDNAVTSF